jgi:ATP-dependent DNA ligase
MIEVPYWWDRKYSSLAATTYSQRPDLFTTKPTEALPIPIKVPGGQQPRSESITFLRPYPDKIDVTKKILMTATEWDSSTMNPTGWWLTEKYDGMRLYWNGSEFFSRQGNIVKVPEFIKKHLPKVALDGELW